MSRQFDTGGGADSITFSVGNAPPDQGPITIAVLAKAFSTAGWTGFAARGTKTGTGVWSLLTSNNAGAKLFAENDFGNGVGGLSTSWRWYVMTKASGSALPRFHVWDLSGAWSHTDNSANVGDNTGPIDAIIVGGSGAGNNGWRGSIAVVATFTSQLNDAAIEATFTLAASATFNASPGWMIRLNQASTATSVTDDTGGGGNQSAISGTSVDADDPPGFNYALTNNVDGQAAQTVTATQTATAEVDRLTTAAQAITATQAAAGQVLLGQTATQTVTATGLATGQVIANATAAQTITAVGLITRAPDPPVSTGSWESYLTGIREARAVHAERARRNLDPLDCPIHLWPLQPLGGHAYHCLFGGHVVHGHT